MKINGRERPENASENSAVKTITVRSNGRITIPIELRRELDWTEGDVVTFEVMNGAIYVSRVGDEDERVSSSGRLMPVNKPSTDPA
jgi:AbrB family looped-hinge helix DNA binding protein